MMSPVKFTFNNAEFNRVLQHVANASSRTYPQFLNGQALRMASFAVRETERADTSMIAAKLGQVSTRIVSLRGGKMLKRPRRVFSSKASLDLYRIINWRRKRTGKAPIGGAEMSVKARQIRGAALSSTAFIASGWIYAVRVLSKLAGYTVANAYKGPKMTGQEKGWVTPARFALSAQVACTMGNSALLAISAGRTGARSGRPLAVAVRGMVRARNLTARDMLDHLAKKLQPVLNQFSAR